MFQELEMNTIIYQENIFMCWWTVKHIMCMASIFLDFERLTYWSSIILAFLLLFFVLNLMTFKLFSILRIRVYRYMYQDTIDECSFVAYCVTEFEAVFHCL